MNLFLMSLKMFLIYNLSSQLSQVKVPCTRLQTTALTLTLVLLNLVMPCLCKQCRSRWVGFFMSQLIWICTVCHSKCECVYQQPGSSYLIGWQLDGMWHFNLFSMTRVNYWDSMQQLIRVYTFATHPLVLDTSLGSYLSTYRKYGKALRCLNILHKCSKLWSLG